MYEQPRTPRKELPPNGGNAQLGCGLAVREIKGHRYVYFWAYEERTWGSKRKWTYVGPATQAGTRGRARDLLVAYHQHVRVEIERRIAALQAVAAHG